MPSVQFSSSYSVSYWGSITAYVRLTFSESYNQVTNQTTLSLTGIEFKKNGSANCGQIPVFGSISVEGQLVCTIDNLTNYSYVSLNGDGWCSASLPSRNSVTVTHNADGTRSVSVTVTAGSNSRFCAQYAWYHQKNKIEYITTYVPFGVPTSSGTMALKTHPRASSISSCTNPATTGSNINLTVSRNSAAFNHVATVYIGGQAVYTSGRFDTSLPIPVPRSWFSSYPSNAALTATVSVQTYSGNTAIGSAVSTNITINADAGMKPSVSAGWAALAPYNTGAVSGMTGYVKGYSQAEASFDDSKIDMSDAVGASIVSYSVTCQGETNSTPPYLTPVLASTSVQVICTVTDTRGRTASETFELSVYDYSAPFLTEMAVIRSNSSGVKDEDGQYFKVTATANFSSVNGQNSCTLTAAAAVSGGAYGQEYDLANGAEIVSGTSQSRTFGGSYSPDSSYTIRITATDSIGNSIYWYAIIPTRKWAMKFRVSNNEVTGIAFGKAAETDNIFEITSDWELKIEGRIIKPVLTPSAAFAIPASGSSVSYDMDGLTDKHELVRWNFSASAENAPPAALTWTTYDGYFTITNNGGTTSETMRPVFEYPAAVVLTAH